MSNSTNFWHKREGENNESLKLSKTTKYTKKLHKIAIYKYTHCKHFDNYQKSIKYTKKI